MVTCESCRLQACNTAGGLMRFCWVPLQWEVLSTYPLQPADSQAGGSGS